MLDEIDETGNIEGATKLLEFLASKQRKSAVILVLAGQRATATWTGGSGVRINLSTVVTGMLARDSEARHAVGAENEIPDISEYSRGEAGFFGRSGLVRAKKLIQPGAGPSTSAGSATSRGRSSAKRDPAARPVLEGAGEVTAPAPAAPREQAGSGLRERLANVQALNEGRPLPAGAGERSRWSPACPRRSRRDWSGSWPAGPLLGRGGRAGPRHVQVRRAPVPRRTASRPGSSRRPAAAAGQPGGGSPARIATVRTPAVHHARGTSPRPCTTAWWTRRRAAGGPGAGPADRPPAAPDPRSRAAEVADSDQVNRPAESSARIVARIVQPAA